MIDKNIQFASDLRTVVTRLTKKLRKLSQTGLQFSFTERSTLSLLLHNENGLLPSELAAAEKITNQSMSQILNRFLKDGLITRTASETDKRKVIIAITDIGKQVISQVLSERDEWLAEAISEVFSEEEYNIVKSAIGPLTKLVDFE
jgi:DNA-binding MarR family transcriptional regulator